MSLLLTGFALLRSTPSASTLERINREVDAALEFYDPAPGSPTP